MSDKKKTKAQLIEELQRLRHQVAELQKSKAKHRAWFDHIADPIMVFDQETELFLDCNQATLDRYGYTLDELRAMTPHDLHPPDELELVDQHMDDKDEIGPHCHTHITRNGERLPVEIHIDQVRYEGRDAWISIVWDITERVRSEEERARAEEALRRSEEQYRLLAENVTDIIWTTDMNLRFTYMSPSVARLGGYSVDEAMAMSFEELLTPASFEIAMKAFAEELAAESTRQGEAFWSRVLELEQQRKDGSTAWTEVTTSFLHDPEGQPVGIVGVTRDITERKRTEKEIKRRGEELEALREMSLAITAQLELDELLRNVVERSCRLLSVGAGGVYLADENNGDLELVVSHGFTRDCTGTRMAPGEGLAGRVLQSGAPLAVDDYHHWEGRSPDWETEPLTAVLGVPLKRGEQVIGVLEFTTSDRGRAFDEHDVWLATLFANQTAIAIENARLYQAEQRGREVAEALQETARVVNASLDLDEVLPIILDQLAQVIQYDSSAVLLLDDNRFKVTAGRGFPDLEATLQLSFSADEDTVSSAVVRARRPLIIEDVQSDPRWQQGPETAHIHGWIGAPLIVRDRIIGVLTADSRRPAAYSEEDGQLAFSFANQAAVAIENARLYEDQQRRLHDLSLLHEISTRVSASLDPQEVLKHIVQGAVEAVGADAASINLLIAPGEAQMMASVGLSERFKQRTDVRPAGTTMTVIRTGKPLLIPDVTQQPDLVKSVVLEEGIQSFNVLPLPGREHVIGAMFVLYRQCHQFSDDEVRLLTTLANQAAVAIENARLYEAERAALQQMGTLYRVGQAVNSALDINTILDRLTDEAMQATRATHGQVLLVQAEAGVFERRSLRGFSPQEAERARTIPLRLDQGINGQAYCTRQAVRIDDAQSDPDYFPLIPETRTELAVPIIRGEQVLGNLDLQSPEAGAFRDVDLDYLSALTDQASIALENTRLFQAEHEQRQLAETLREVASALNTSLDRPKVLSLILEQLARVVDYDSASVMLLSASGERLDVVTQRGFSSKSQEFRSLQVEALPHVQEVLEDRRPVIIADTSADPRWQHRPESEYTRCWLGVPLVAHERVIGLLNLDKEQPGFYTQGDAELATVFANQSAAALENARLYEEVQRELAERRRAEERLARSNEELEQFAYVASHDLQEPLRMVSSYVRLLQRRYKDQLDEDADEFIEFAVDGATRMQTLINDLLTYSRVTTRAKPFEPTDCSVILDSVLTDLKMAIEESNAVVTHDALPTVTADATQLKRVFQNLVSNGIKFRQEETLPEIHVGAEQQDSEWVFSVRDNGIGIDPQHFERMFVLFQRLHGRDEYPGTGIGLAVCKKTVERHGGRMWVESQPGKGSTFYFTIPHKGGST